MKSRFVYFLPSLFMAAVAIGLALFGLMKYDSGEEARKAITDSPLEGSDSSVAQIEQKPRYQYVVALQAIEPGDTLATENFIEIETATPIEGAIAAADVPYDLTIETFMEPGELLMSQTLAKQSVIRQVVPDGFTAIAFEMSGVSSIGGLLKPGDYVNVLASFKGRGDTEASSKTLLEAVEVLAVQGQTTAGNSSSEEDRRRNSTMVLSVPEDRVGELVLASREAQLNFAAIKRAPELEKDPEAPEQELAVSDSAVFLSDLVPESPRAARRNASAPERQAEDPGHKVQVFEGSAARNVYVQ